MSARYLVRLDDACATMRPEIWGSLEQVLDELRIRPIVGVIPDNRDPDLSCAPPDPDFWSRVRAWQAKGWSVALHGLHHAYHAIPAGAKALIDLHNQSEFAGLPLERQRAMLQQGCSTMLAHNVVPSMFMAPSHTFDTTTLQALREGTDIRVIADGYALKVFEASGFRWIPQQLWRFRRMPFGLWCICLHPNAMSEHDLRVVIEDLRRYAGNVVDVETAMRGAGRRRITDIVFAAMFRIALRIKQRMRNRRV